jgi:hypothetical protein
MFFMTTKYCPKCDKDKSLEDDFYKNKSKKDGHQAICKKCVGKNLNRYYVKNKAKLKASIEVSRLKRAAENKQFVLDYLKEHPCLDCGEPDPVVLEFDHIGKKNIGIAAMINRGNSLDAIQAEIALCQVRCANCHRRKTAKDKGYFRLSAA